jgi:hypothetical protein
VVAKAEHLPQGANPRFVVTSLPASARAARILYEDVYCARGEVENRIKEQQLDLFADRTSAATMRANQLRLWFASFAYVLLEALRRIGLRHTQFASATCGTIRLKLLKIGAQVRKSVRRIKVAMASACPYQTEYHLAYLYLKRAAFCASGIPEPAPASGACFRMSGNSPLAGIRAPRASPGARAAPVPAQNAHLASGFEKSGLGRWSQVRVLQGAPPF